MSSSERLTVRSLLSKPLPWLVGLVLSILLLVANLSLSGWQERASSDARTAASELQGLASQVMGDGRAAIYGEDAATLRLRQSRLDTERAVKAVVSLRTSDSTLSEQVAKVESAWQDLNQSAQTIEKAAEQGLLWHEQASRFTKNLPRLQQLANELANATAGGTPSPNQTAMAMQQAILVAGLGRSLGDVGVGGENATVGGENFKRDLALFEQRMMRLGEAARMRPELAGPYTALQNYWNTMAGDGKALGDGIEAMLAMQAAGREAEEKGRSMMLAGNALNKAVSNVGTVRDGRIFPNFWWNVVGGGLAMVSLALFLVASMRTRNLEQEARVREKMEESGRTQQAIMQLLSEIEALGDGDLTVKAPVTEDATGAIADAINYAVDELRNLVTTINDSAVTLASSSSETQTTTQALAQGAQQQFEQIDHASTRMDEMANSVQQVHKSADEGAEVAQRAVLIATEGANVVRETIRGMDSIRDQIQETSKRIKRLGESTQEIGSIIELIKDISEQTNVLSLNAAMRAASAGEEKRGFAVVADEVQRLADRTALATKRIETLVNAIQADTNDAVSSMEQTTSEVVSGARLAEDAGMALDEIVKVSQSLDGKIKLISEAAQQQYSTASEIHGAMNIVRQISGRTREDATHTATSVGRLAEVAAALRASVAGFKLPNQTDGEQR